MGHILLLRSVSCCYSVDHEIYDSQFFSASNGSVPEIKEYMK